MTKTIVLTREDGLNGRVREWLPDDVEIVVVPLTTTRYFDPTTVRLALQGLDQAGRFVGLVLTSARSADYVEVAREFLAEPARIFAVGPATADALAAQGVRVDVVGEGGAMGLYDWLPTEGPIVQLGAHGGREELRDAIRARGQWYSVVACYESIALDVDESGRAALRRADYVVIGAPSAWRVAAPFVREATTVIVPGLTTAAAVRAGHANVLEVWGPALREALGG